MFWAKHHNGVFRAAPVPGSGGHPEHDEHIGGFGKGPLDQLLTIFAFWGVLGALHGPKPAPDWEVLESGFGPLSGLFDQAAVGHDFFQNFQLCWSKYC